MIDAEKREKVIAGLEAHANMETACATAKKEECPYYGYHDKDKMCSEKLAEDALAILKKQEPRVMTVDEVKQHDNQDGCVWFEQPTYNAVAAFVRQDEECTEIISPYLLGEPINHGYMSNIFYGETWRCWTSRPTPDQMRDTPWEGEENHEK